MNSRNALIAILAAAGTVAAAPVMAQSFTNRDENLSWRIDRGLRDGSLTPREAYRLRRELYRVERRGYRYARDGLSYWEMRDLDGRYDRISRHVRRQRHDRQRGYGR